MNKAMIGKLMLAGAIAMAATPAVADAASHGRSIAGTHQVGWRFAEQQARINNGLRSGQLTAAEYQRDEARLRTVEAQRASDIQAGGALTRVERGQLRTELNHDSDRIWRSKHNTADGQGVSTVW